MALFCPHAVLFDLDGTLIDSAPDLLGALDHVLERLGQPPCDRAALRHHASRGAAGILAAGLRVTGAEADAQLKRIFLDHYADHLWDRSRPFAGIDALLGNLAERGCRLGIVTNKLRRFAAPVVHHAGWTSLMACLVSGDDVDAPKPAPDPVIEACRRLGVAPAHTVYVGDDRRDVEAGARAGAGTVVAGWGYLPPDEDIAAWGADLLIARPGDLIEAMAPPDTRH